MGRFIENFLPKVMKVRSNADANLSGAKLRWTPHSERFHLKALIAVHCVIVVGLVHASLPWVGGLVWLFFILFETMTAMLLYMAMWYDDLIWEGRTVKPGDLSPIPWRPNLYLFDKRRGKYQIAGASLADSTASDHASQPKDIMTYGIAFCDEVERWFTGEPPDGTVIVSPVIDSADPVKTGDRGAMGLGFWEGLQYRVPGTPHIYFLGRDGMTKWVEDGATNRMLVGLDQEIRAEIYRLRPNKKWWSRVIFFEENPKDRKLPMVTPKDMKAIIENMDLRAQLDRGDRAAQKIMASREKIIDRME
jgi:hypothetical protein